MRRCAAQQTRPILHRNRTALAKHRVMHGQQTILDRQRLAHPAVTPCAMHIRALPRCHIRRYRNAPMSARRQEREHRMILARQLAEIRPARPPRMQRPAQIRRRVLHPHNIGMPRQPRHRLHAHIHHAARRYVVDDHRKIGRVRNRHEMQIQPLLRRLVVIRRHRHHRVRPTRPGMPRQTYRFGRAVGPGTRNHRHPSPGRLHRDLDRPLMLGMRERRAFPRRAHRHQPICPLLNLPIDEFRISVLVQAAILAHRGNQGDK